MCLLTNVAELDKKHYLMANLAFKRTYTSRQFMIHTNCWLPESKSHLRMIGDAVSSTLKWIGLKTEKKVEEKAQSMIKKLENQPVYIECGVTIELKDYEIIEKIFMYFGRLVLNLKIVYDEDHVPQAKFIGIFISNYSSNSLVDVEFRHCTDHTLEYITMPLMNVKNVNFGNSFGNTGGEIISFNHLFPTVESLQLNCWFTHIHYIDTQMPRLKHLFMKIDVKYWWNDFRYIENIEKFLQKNAYLRSIEIQIVPEAQMILLQPINENLQNLEILSIWQCEELDAPFLFENVTTFIVKLANTLSANFYFPILLFI